MLHAVLYVNSRVEPCILPSVKSFNEQFAEPVAKPFAELVEALSKHRRNIANSSQKACAKLSPLALANSSQSYSGRDSTPNAGVGALAELVEARPFYSFRVP